MKNLLLAVLALCVLLAGCGSAPRTETVSQPRSYAETMDLLAGRLKRVDKFVMGSDYGASIPDAQVAVHYARLLGQFEPPRIAADFNAFNEYSAQAEDMARAADRLLFLIEQRRPEECDAQLADIATKFNRMSVAYGPNYQIGVLDRGSDKFRSADLRRSDVPGELLR
ncbi:MAG: hypothetical protein IT463_12570 [Planctomycetes bacterium]|nr:hypothetical protein [Planctomycetota bacterium]